jgi:hypothetical protein
MESRHDASWRQVRQSMTTKDDGRDGMAGDGCIPGGHRVVLVIRRAVMTQILNGRGHRTHRECKRALKEKTDFFFKAGEHIIEFTFSRIWCSIGRGHMGSSVPNGVGDKLFDLSSLLRASCFNHCVELLAHVSNIHR